MKRRFFLKNLSITGGSLLLVPTGISQLSTNLRDYELLVGDKKYSCSANNISECLDIVKDEVFNELGYLPMREICGSPSLDVTVVRIDNMRLFLK